MRAGRAGRLAILGVLAGMIVVPAVSTAAFAHDSLVDADPAADATVTTLTEVALTFSADPIDAEDGNIVQLKGPDGKYYETGCPELDGPVATSAVGAGPAGTYEVLWRVVSSDGHPVSDSYTFTYAPDGTAAPATGADEPVCATASDSASESDPAPQDAGEDAGAISPVWIGIGIGAVAIAAIAIVAWLLIRLPREREGG